MAVDNYQKIYDFWKKSAPADEEQNILPMLAVVRAATFLCRRLWDSRHVLYVMSSGVIIAAIMTPKLDASNFPNRKDGEVTDEFVGEIESLPDSGDVLLKSAIFCPIGD